MPPRVNISFDFIFIFPYKKLSHLIYGFYLSKKEKADLRGTVGVTFVGPGVVETADDNYKCYV